MVVRLMYRGVVIRAIETVKRGTKHEFVSAMLRSFIREVTLSLSLSLSLDIHITYITKTDMAGTEKHQRQAPSLDPTQTDLRVRHSQLQILI